MFLNYVGNVFGQFSFVRLPTFFNAELHVNMEKREYIKYNDNNNNIS